MTKAYKQLTQEQVDFFLENGYVCIKGAFTKEKSDEWTKDMWRRLGMDPNDKSTWGEKDRIHMPQHKRESVSTFAPKAWDAMVDLLGGTERIDESSGYWNDAFIVNFGTPDLVDAPSIDPRNLINWHADGDFFVHYLDSPEQALLVIPLFSEIKPRGGGTFISPDGLETVSQYLSKHPEGVLPSGLSFTPSTTTYAEKTEDPGYISLLEVAKNSNRFIEVTGEIGDVFLLHPHMLHSAARNHLRVPRIITNPPVGLREPFNFNRADPSEYSLVEKKTLQALGTDKFPFQATTARRMVVPARVAAQQKLLEEERRRLGIENAAREQESAARSVAVA